MSIIIYNAKTKKVVKVIFDNCSAESKNEQMQFITKYIPYHKKFRRNPWLLLKYLGMDLTFFQKIQIVFSIIFKKLVP
jgi:hypothetical protein